LEKGRDEELMGRKEVTPLGIEGLQDE